MTTEHRLTVSNLTDNNIELERQGGEQMWQKMEQLKTQLTETQSELHQVTVELNITITENQTINAENQSLRSKQREADKHGQLVQAKLEVAYTQLATLTSEHAGA